MFFRFCMISARRAHRLMKTPSLFPIVLFLLLILSCNENKTSKVPTNVEEPYITYELDGFQRKYLDENLQEVNYKSKAAYYREAYYSNGRPVVDSITKDYYMTGELKFIGHKSTDYPDDVIGQATWYHKNGNIEKQYTTNSNGEIEGQELTFYEDGAKKSITNYENGKLNGQSLEYYNNGKLKSEYYYRNDLANGICKDYFENGNLQMSSNMVDGKQDGVGYEYYESGKLWASSHYVKGELHGEEKEYYENGKLKSKGKYKNGNKTGLWEYYDQNGSRSYKDYNRKDINSRQMSSTTIDTSSEGYDAGYLQGLNDGRNGSGHGDNFDDVNNYHDEGNTRYQEGYSEGYNDGYSLGKSEFEENKKKEEEAKRIKEKKEAEAVCPIVVEI